MTQSSNQNRSSGSRSSHRGGGRNRGGGNKSSGGNRGGKRGGRGQGKRPGSGSSRGFVKQKVPRRTKPLSWWEKLLGLIGLGPKPRKPPVPTRPPKEGNAAASLRAAGGVPGSKPAKRGGAAKKRAPQKKPNPTRKPERVPVSGTRLHVGNLSYDTTDTDLDQLFGKWGDVVRCEVVSHSRSGRSKGFAFVEMASVADAQRAAEELHDTEFMGRPMTVGGAKSERPPR